MDERISGGNNGMRGEETLGGEARCARWFAPTANAARDVIPRILLPAADQVSMRPDFNVRANVSDFSSSGFDSGNPLDAESAEPYP